MMNLGIKEFEAIDSAPSRAAVSVPSFSVTQETGSPKPHFAIIMKVN
jgi:hypothetical protein